MLSPIDLIPDFIPIIGLLDDLIIVPALIVFSIKLISKKVLNDAREKIENNHRQYKKTNWIFAIIIIIGIRIAVLIAIAKAIYSRHNI